MGAEVKSFFHNKRIFVIMLALMFVAVSVFYFIRKPSEESQPSETAKEFSLEKDPVRMFMDLLSRQKTAHYRAVYE